MKSNCTVYLFWSAAVILIVTGVLKLVSALGEARLLSRSDPLFWFATNRQVLVVAAALELGIGILLIRHDDVLLRALLLAWLSTSFVAYRIGLWWIGYVGDCPCLGRLAEWLPIKPAALTLLTKAALAYLLFIAYALLVYNASRRKACSECLH